MSDLSNSPSVPRYPQTFISRKSAIIRIRNEQTQEIEQHRGVIYKLDPKNSSALALYGGHQVIVLNQEIADFENYTIVALVELW